MIMSHVILDIAAVVGRRVTAVRLVVTRGFPLQVKLINVLCIFCLNELCDELKLFAESQDGLLEDRHLPWRPFLEDADRSDWVYEDVEVSLLVEMVDSIEV